MVLCCCICKISFGEIEHLSFHSLPSNESSKVEWLSAINKTVSKSSRVCSRHFKSTDFKYKIQNGKICKSLTSDAVPSLMLNTSSEAENIEPTTPDTLDSSSNILCENLLLATSSTDLQNNQECFQSCQNICDKESHNEDSQTDNEVITLESRSKNPIDSSTAALSPNANPVSLKSRFKKKVSTFEDLLDHLKEVGLISKEGLDAVKLHSSPALPEIMKNILSTKKYNSYSPALKDFACSLLFYSSAAYKFVRDQFLEALPCPQTVRRCLNGKELQFGLQLDEMSVKKLIELKHNVWYGLVDIGGLGKNNSEEASYVLVAMLVCLNGHFKTPVAYYFIKSLCGQARSNMLQEILLTLHENGISDVRSVTFDGASSNLSMVSELGANTTDIDQKCSFEHPTTVNIRKMVHLTDFIALWICCRGSYSE
ncbi:uncharacterized protein LOC105251182 [Camponotus floridanus]|uniref:uncharacterized protein LOC105251182 n=1 Tax=Camponotus floridanus TaxID=104421 RepID=UPI000DC67816|nr:uncharacterized protein LOC105251182 [Camponotus floridanus]